MVNEQLVGSAHPEWWPQGVAAGRSGSREKRAAAGPGQAHKTWGNLPAAGFSKFRPGDKKLQSQTPPGSRARLVVWSSCLRNLVPKTSWNPVTLLHASPRSKPYEAS